MSAPLAWTLDERAGHTIVTVRGELNLRATPALQTALWKCLAEQPVALLIDLAEMRLRDEVALSIFTAVARQATTWPGVPVLLCAPPPDIDALLRRGRFGRLAVHRSMGTALRAVAEGDATGQSITDRLLPLAGAVRHARDVATEACSTWGLPELVGPASLVVSELVTNAIEHAATMMTLRIERRSRYLHIAVRDGSAAEPRLTPRPAENALSGRGLLLVDSVAAHWGSMPSRDGKVVWATLAIGPDA